MAKTANDKIGSNRAMRIFYGNPTGRLVMKGLLKARMPKAMAAYLRSPLSKGMIRRYIKKNGIDMSEYEEKKYRSFADFFARRKLVNNNDTNPNHLTSPCDGWLSAYKIEEDSSFAIKGSHYRICDLMDDPELAEKYKDGVGLVFRLSPSDYHHYSFVDDGYIHKNNFIEGKLHSVQPIACSKLPVFRLNRRVWSLLNTVHFGPVVQIEVGALAVGGIVNEYEHTTFQKGDTMGHFELCGSTIVLLIQKHQIELLPEIEKVLESNREYQVKQGMWIASKPESEIEL